MEDKINCKHTSCWQKRRIFLYLCGVALLCERRW